MPQKDHNSPWSRHNPITNGHSYHAPQFIRTITEALDIIDGDDVIHDCGPAVLAILKRRPDDVMRLAHEKLHAWPFRDVPKCWSRLFEEASIWRVVKLLQVNSSVLDGEGMASRTVSPRGHKRSHDGTIDPGLDTTGNRDGIDVPHAAESTMDDGMLSEVVKTLDMAVILTGGRGRKAVIDRIFHELQLLVPAPSPLTERGEKTISRFPTVTSPSETTDTIERRDRLDFVEFQDHLDTAATPLIIKGVMNDWPAIYDPDRKWSNPQYLMERTLGGRRLVPVELGRCYTEDDWGQKIMTFGEYTDKHLLNPQPDQVGYLAQHDLLEQIPRLSDDTITPDYCYTAPPPATVSGLTPQPPLDEPLRNAWLGPKGTISPLHTDPYHNILCQVVGKKYIRLYHPSETHRLYPRGVDEAGVSMENTSRVDISEVRRLYDGLQTGTSGGNGAHTAKEHFGKGADVNLERERSAFETKFPLYRGAQFLECILEAGECLYIPVGWWHYIESLEVSFNVSYWWN